MTAEQPRLDKYGLLDKWTICRCKMHTDFRKFSQKIFETEINFKFQNVGVIRNTDTASF